MIKEKKENNRTEIKKKKKILFVSEYYPPIIKGGGEINISLIANHLAEKLKETEYQVHVLTSKQENLPRIERKKNVIIHRKLRTAKDPSGIINNLIRSIIFPLFVKREIKKIKPEITHFIGISFISAKRIKGKKFATIESYPSLCPKGDRIYKNKKICPYRCNFLKFLKCQYYSEEIGKTKNRFWIKYNPFILTYIYLFYKRLNKSLRYVNPISISNYLKEILSKNNLKSNVLPNIIETEKFLINNERGNEKDKENNNNNNEDKKKKKKNEEDDYDSDYDKRVEISYLGSLTKFKGPHILAKASKNLDCNLNFYGDGTIKEELNKIIKGDNLSAKIHAPVPYDQVPQIYANSDIIVFPSLWPEPFGRITIEAGAAGKPVVGSKVGAIAETITNNGILYSPNNVQELHEILKELISNKKLRVKLGENGQKKVKENYSPEKIINDLIKIYGLY